MSVKALLTRPDLSGCLQLESNIAEDGASHSRRGANYGANQDTNSMAAHLNNEHPEYSRDPLAIKFSVTKTGPKCLERQVREAFQLANMDPDRIIDIHMEFVAPAIQRMTHINLLDDGRNRATGN